MKAERGSLGQRGKAHALRDLVAQDPVEGQIQRWPGANILEVPAFGPVREDEHWSNRANVPAQRQDQSDDEARQ